MGRSFRTAALLLLCLAFAFATAPSTTHAVDDEFPTCEDVGTCVNFDPPAAAPGTTVTITPGSEEFIPIVSECPPEGRLRMDLEVATAVVSSPLVGDDQLARFTVPDVPPGEYEASVFCGAINSGMGVGVFRVLAVEAPQGTPTPTPEATPTPAGTPTPSPTPTPRPHGGVIDVYKIIDADGNLDTVDDQTAGEGWAYELELTDATIVDAFPVTDESGFAEFLIEFDAEGPTATVSEVLQEDFELIAASCVTFHGPEDGEVTVGELAGDSVSFRLEPREFPYNCFFYNAPTADDSGFEIRVRKFIDADGDLDTVDDQMAGVGWLFQLELTDGTIEQGLPPTDERGVARSRISFGPGGTTATLTEVLQEDFEPFDVDCYDKFGTGSQLVSELDGHSVTFQIHPYFFRVECDFYNTPSREGNVGGETATPPSSTLPPTDTGRPTSAPALGTWGALFVVLAAILAAALASLPKAPTDRTRRR